MFMLLMLVVDFIFGVIFIKKMYFKKDLKIINVINIVK